MLAWKRLTATLNPRTLASGIKRISAVLSPGKITQAAKADVEIEQWEDAMTRLNIEYDQEISAKMKVAVLYSMLPKDLQEKVLDECSVNWDGTSEADAAEKFAKIKNNVKNLAKSRREMMGPKPMEVDRVKISWADYAEDEWDTCWDKGEQPKEEYDQEAAGEEQAYVQFVGAKGGKKGGKGASKVIARCAGSLATRSGIAARGRARASARTTSRRGTARTVASRAMRRATARRPATRAVTSTRGAARATTPAKGACRGRVSGAGH